MFLQVCVCPQEGGGGIPACLVGGIPACLAAGLWGVVSWHALQMVSQHALQQVSRGVPAPGGVPALEGVPVPGVCVWRRPPGQQMATDADCMHPTGMHSCFRKEFDIFPSVSTRLKFCQ